MLRGHAGPWLWHGGCRHVLLLSGRVCLMATCPRALLLPPLSSVLCSVQRRPLPGPQPSLPLHSHLPSAHGPLFPCVTISSNSLRAHSPEVVHLVCSNVTGLFYFLKILFIYFFRERGREGRREGEKHQCVRNTWLPLRHAPHWEPGPQPRHVP